MEYKDYDLLIHGGTIVDPGENLNSKMDIGIKNGVIIKIASNISKIGAKRIIDANDKIVTPGLIDLHTHVYWGSTTLGVDANWVAGRSGCTTLVDAGSSGAATFPGFKKYVIGPALCHVYAFLNLSIIGITTLRVGEYENLRYCNIEMAVRTIEKNRNKIVGIKVRASGSAMGLSGITPLDLGRAVAERVNLPMMVHIADSGLGPRGATSPKLSEVLERMRPSDILTHSFTGSNMKIIDQSGKIRPEVRDALEKGIILDVGHGAAGFSKKVTQSVLEAGIYPDTISTDIHLENAWGPVYDLPTTLSKFLAFGMSLEEVILRTTKNPADAIGKGEELGNIKIGTLADLGVFELQEGNFEFKDSYGETISGSQRLMPVMTICEGKILQKTEKQKPERIPWY